MLNFSEGRFREKKSIMFQILLALLFQMAQKLWKIIFFGSEIDRSLVFKVAISEAKREAFIRNEIFENGNHVKSDKHFTNKQDWRKVDELTERIHRNLGLPYVKFVECTVGRENGKTHVYVSWFEI